MLIRAICTSQSFQPSHWVMGERWWKLRRDRSTIKYSTDAELQSARNSSRVRRRPDGGFLPRDVARESRKSDKPYRRLNARRPSGNKSRNLPSPSDLFSSSPRPYFVFDPHFRYLNVIVREKGRPRVNSRQSIAREFNYRNWPREDEFARDIFRRESTEINVSARDFYCFFLHYV